MALAGRPLLLGLVLRVRLPEAPLPSISSGHRHRSVPWLLLGIALVTLLALLLGLGLAPRRRWLGLVCRGDWSLIAHWRLPRVLAAFAAGGMLALAGLLIQRS